MSGPTNVRLADGSEALLPEPAWCTGSHEHGLHLVDTEHDGPETALTVDTRHGPIHILNAQLTQRPYATRAEDRGVAVAVLLDGGWHRYNAAGLYDLADRLAERAVELRALARHLTELQ